MFHKVKHKVEGSFVFPKFITCIFLLKPANSSLPEIHSLLLVSDYFSEFDNVLVFQLSQDFDFSDSGDWETFLLIFKSDFLECQQLARLNVELRWRSGLVDFTVGSFSDLREHVQMMQNQNNLSHLVNNLVHVHTTLPPVPAVICHGTGLHLVNHDGLLQLLASFVSVLVCIDLGQRQTHYL